MAPKIPLNNPAGRLHDLLTQAVRQSEQQNTRQAWAAVFGVDPTDTGAILQSLAALIEQIAVGKEEVLKLADANHDLFLEPFLELEKSFTQVNLEASWKGFKSRIGSETLVKLRYCADKLGEVRAEEVLEKDQLAELRHMVEELIDEVAEAELPSQLKLLLLRNLETARMALLQYRIRGLDGLRTAADLNLGAVFRECVQGQPESARGVMNKVWTFAVRLNTVISMAQKLKSLPVPDLDELLKLPAGGG